MQGEKSREEKSREEFSRNEIKQKCLDYFLTQTGPEKKKTRRLICWNVRVNTGQELEGLQFDRLLKEFRESGYDIRVETPAGEDDETHYYYVKKIE